MVSKITDSVKVTVNVEYDSKNSYPSDNRFVFRYHITIENFREDAIILLRRKWVIFDTGFGFTEITGDGVIGLTPKIEPGEQFSYFSNVILRSGFGHMSGKYYLKNLLTENVFEIEIPKFNLHSAIHSN